MSANLRHLFPALLAITLLTTPAGGVHAADSDDSKTKDQKSQAEKEPAFDLSFPGGSLPELVAALEKAGGRKINVMLPPETAHVVVPRLSLTGVDAEAVFRSLNILLNEPRAVGQFGHTGNIWVYQALPEVKQSRVFFVGFLLAKFSIEDLTTAIRTAWNMESNQPDGELKFHKDTQLLFARATSAQLEMVHAVLGELAKSASMPTPNPGVGATPEKAGSGSEK